MGTWAFSPSPGSGVSVPLSGIRQIRLVFPAERLVHRSRGIDREAALPTRYYETPSGPWSTDDRALLRLLHNDVPFLIEQVAQVPRDRELVAVSTNYGSNPYYCIRRPSAEVGASRLFHLEQERLDEDHFGLMLVEDADGLRVSSVTARFDPVDARAFGADGSPLPEDACIITAPPIVWNGDFVGWDCYARTTYDCRHVFRVQYVDRARSPDEFERNRAEIQRVQRLWPDRDAYVQEVSRLAAERGYASYERLILGVGGEGSKRYLLLSSNFGTASEVASQLKAQYPGIESAFQITEGGGTGVLTGTPAEWRVLGASTYRRGRVLCCLLAELKAEQIA